MKKKYKLCLFFLVVLFFNICPVMSQAQELPSGMVVGDDKGISVRKDGRYLVQVNDVLPGKKWHTTISMMNMEKDIPYKLSMLISSPRVTGILDLSEAIQMKITYQSKLVYEGPVSGITKERNLQNAPLDLGVFKAGDSRAMEVDFWISGEYTNKDFSKKNVMENDWIFYAVKAKASTNVPKDSNNSSKILGLLPKTGEEWRQAILYTCLGLFFLLLILLVWKSDRKKIVDKLNK
ncbi:hypothetical protein [Enterococcus wangshanyuanii]|uniref:Gram-positive cocci surface proteins LPxTG domain-containing protein n=1 Tax=Enterococcus wangshanyuanii TaxID=2005703 RepID=A0ABQ1PSL8_9ENTE|nr:hypothetical protein [Enterococcus wangshanyuanii]GGD03004.1 hypothetical protein GCM10011573_35600 [Enterococcus wangshanyuanii]